MVHFIYNKTLKSSFFIPALFSTIFLTGCISNPMSNKEIAVQKTAHDKPSSSITLYPTLPHVTIKKTSSFLESLSESDLKLIKKETLRATSVMWHNIDKRAQLVRHRLLQALDELDAPRELQFIPVAESGYNPYALSPAGALGLWQLMPRTARSLGAHHENGIDERRHIEESTKAAATYFLRLRARFDSWPLAICAYNLGPSGVSRRLRKNPWTPEDGLNNLPFPAETRHYVKQVLGMIALAQDEQLKFSKPLHTQKTHVSAPIDLTQLEELSGLKRNALYRLNPELDFQHYIHKDLSLHLPEDNVSNLAFALNDNPDIFKPKFISIRIQEGDSLWMLAKRHHTTVRHLKQLNPKQGHLLSLGKTLVVPASKSFSVASSKANPLLSTGRRIRYKVKNGDSLWKIAKKFGTTSHAIARANQMSRNKLIKPGDKLWIIARLQPS